VVLVRITLSGSLIGDAGVVAIGIIALVEITFGSRGFSPTRPVQNTPKLAGDERDAKIAVLLFERHPENHDPPNGSHDQCRNRRNLGGAFGGSVKRDYDRTKG
jgi:hypothetical protein